MTSTATPSVGQFEHLLLLAVLRLDVDAHGISIRAEILERTGRELSPGAIYTGLSRLQKRGLVDSELGSPTAVRGGKRKRYYSLTAEGSEAVRQAYHQLQAMAADLLPKAGSQ